MTTANQIPTRGAKDQREALKRSERNATTTEPQNFRDEANADKVVEIPPDKENAPIQGIDPDDRGRKSR
jgi:hypothetical protein